MLHTMKAAYGVQIARPRFASLAATEYRRAGGTSSRWRRNQNSIRSHTMRKMASKTRRQWALPKTKNIVHFPSVTVLPQYSTLFLPSEGLFGMVPCKAIPLQLEHYTTPQRHRARLCSTLALSVTSQNDNLRAVPHYIHHAYTHGGIWRTRQQGGGG